MVSDRQPRIVISQRSSQKPDAEGPTSNPLKWKHQGTRQEPSSNISKSPLLIGNLAESN
ncbi:unnamed protein product [Prunus armeniaca]